MGPLLSGICPELTGLTSSLTTTLSATASIQGPLTLGFQAPFIQPQLLRSRTTQSTSPVGDGTYAFWGGVAYSGLSSRPWVERWEAGTLSSVKVAWEKLTGSQGRFLPISLSIEELSYHTPKLASQASTSHTGPYSLPCTDRQTDIHHTTPHHTKKVPVS